MTDDLAAADSFEETASVEQVAVHGVAGGIGWVPADSLAHWEERGFVRLTEAELAELHAPADDETEQVEPSTTGTEAVSSDSAVDDSTPLFEAVADASGTEDVASDASGPTGS